MASVDAALYAALGHTVAMAERLLVRLQNEVISLVRLEADLARLDDSLAGLGTRLNPLMQPLEAKVGLGLDARTHQFAVDDFGALLAQACAVYDDYFGVVRCHPQTLLQLTGQVVRTSQALLFDLPHTLLDRTQVVMIVANVGRMLAVLADRLGGVLSLSKGVTSSAAANAQPMAESAATRRAVYDLCWQQNAADAARWSQTVAFYRWKVGHHFFDLCTIFCGDALRRAHRAIAENDEDAGVEEFGQADSFLRGTTAAMWYAGDFPANLYRDFVRPSMVMPGKASGFSGDQNADYNRMKDAKAQLKELLCQSYGPTLAGLPPRLLRAFMAVHEADIEDNEHHLIIAAHKVGTDQSLAQKEWQDELPSHIHRQKAVDVLREMAERKRREFMGRS